MRLMTLHYWWADQQTGIIQDSHLMCCSLVPNLYKKGGWNYSIFYSLLAHLVTIWQPWGRWVISWPEREWGEVSQWSRVSFAFSPLRVKFRIGGGMEGRKGRGRCCDEYYPTSSLPHFASSIFHFRGFRAGYPELRSLGHAHSRLLPAVPWGVG